MFSKQSRVKMMEQYRQGDVLIEKMSNLPQGEQTNDRLLVRGEGKDHGHFIEGEVSILLPEDSTNPFTTHYLEVMSESMLQHRQISTMEPSNEHMPVVLPPGKYKVTRQREYNPYSKAIRAIKD